MSWRKETNSGGVGRKQTILFSKTGTIPSFSKMYDFHYHLQTSKIIELTEFVVKTHTYMCYLQCERVCPNDVCELHSENRPRTIPNSSHRPRPTYVLFENGYSYARIWKALAECVDQNSYVNHRTLSGFRKTGTIPSFSKMYDIHYHLQTSKIIELTEFMVKTHTYTCCLQCERVCPNDVCELLSENRPKTIQNSSQRPRPSYVLFENGYFNARIWKAHTMVDHM
jgi:ferredoxin